MTNFEFPPPRVAWGDALWVSLGGRVWAIDLIYAHNYWGA